jgi:predicted methyltransferase
MLPVGASLGMLFVISHYQAQELLGARLKGITEALISSDLNRTTSLAQLDDKGVTFASGDRLCWNDLKAIANDKNACFLLREGQLEKIQYFSEQTDRAFSLYPTVAAPTMLISGIPMHRIKNTDPYHDTLEKIKVLRPIFGSVLDTATGLGYTAIEAARTANQVITVELDPGALYMARHNPWSQELFNNPKIIQRLGDSFDVVGRLETGSFNRVIHDPPAFSLAGHLYSGDFYQELYRILNSGGKLFHYVGDPESKSGRTVTAGVIHRLAKAGFRKIRRAPQSFGVVALK